MRGKQSHLLLLGSPHLQSLISELFNVTLKRPCKYKCMPLQEWIASMLTLTDTQYWNLTPLYIPLILFTVSCIHCQSTLYIWCKAEANENANKGGKNYRWFRFLKKYIASQYNKCISYYQSQTWKMERLFPILGNKIWLWDSHECLNTWITPSWKKEPSFRNKSVVPQG